MVRPSGGASQACLLLKQRAQLRASDVGHRPALHVADALAGALDDPARIGQNGAICELHVDMGDVRNERHRQAAHANTSGRAEAERDKAVGQVKLLAGVGHHLADERLERDEDLAHGRCRSLEEGIHAATLPEGEPGLLVVLSDKGDVSHLPDGDLGREGLNPAQKMASDRRPAGISEGGVRVKVRLVLA